METVLILLIIGVPVGLVGIAVVVIPLAIRAEQNRRNALRHWGMANGWWVTERSRLPPWASRLPGRRSRTMGMMLSTRIGGRVVTIADYSYKTTSGSGDSQSTKTHHYIVVLVQLERAHSPVAVQTRGVLSRLGRELFGERPTATGHVGFDALFRITGPDPAYAKWLVGPQLIGAHLAGAVPVWSVVGPDLLTYRVGRLGDPNLIPGMVGPLLRVADLLGY